MKERSIESEILMKLFGKGGDSIGTEEAPIIVQGSSLSCASIVRVNSDGTQTYMPIPEPLSAVKLEPLLRAVLRLDEDHPNYRLIRDKTMHLLGFFPLYVLGELFINVRASENRVDEFFAELGRFCAHHPSSRIAHKMLASGSAIECFIMLDDAENFKTEVALFQEK